jgi:hypothetical protein
MYVIGKISTFQITFSQNTCSFANDKLLQESFMSSTTSPQNTRAFLAGASLAGAQGFAIAFAAMGLLMRILTLNVTDQNMVVAIGTILYGAAGALGAAYLASAMQWKAFVLLFALAGILGCGGGFLISTLLLNSRVEPESSSRTMMEAVFIAQHAVIGALLGLFLGIALWDTKKLLLLVAAGALGFGIGYLMQASINDLLAEPLADFVARFTQSDALNLIIASLLWGLGSAICGLLGGGAIGYVLDL